MAALLTTVYDRKKELLLFVASNIPACLLYNWLVYGTRYFTEWNLFIISTAVILPLTILLHNTLAFVNLFVRSKLPKYTDTYKRVIISMLLYFMVTSAFILISVWIYQKIPTLKFEVTSQRIRGILLVGIIANLIIGSLYEVLYTITKLKETLVEKETLKKEQLQQQFDSLKSQVNPHFLFNTLSSLSALVEEEPDKADDFLNDMSRVYRYMLRSNHQEWVTLQQELLFIHSYYQLLKTRYGNSISVQVETDGKYNSYMMPPLTLQLLLDNAIKHNTTGKEQPLQIRIATDNNDMLAVKNNLQKKQNVMHNHAAGLKSLAAKFDLKGLRGFSVKEGTVEFIVTVPLSEAGSAIIQDKSI
jgi:two-component system LytT family sensor kinase